jgi:hypothetical protein
VLGSVGGGSTFVCHMGPRATPDTIWLAMLSLKWDVRKVIEDWATPVHWKLLGTPGDTRRFPLSCPGRCPPGLLRAVAAGGQGVGVVEA